MTQPITIQSFKISFQPGTIQHAVHARYAGLATTLDQRIEDPNRKTAALTALHNSMAEFLRAIAYQVGNEV